MDENQFDGANGVSGAGTREARSRSDAAQRHQSMSGSRSTRGEVELKIWRRGSLNPNSKPNDPRERVIFRRASGRILLWIDATGDFGGTTRITGNEVLNFVPRAWNVVLEYAKYKFRALARFNHQDSFLFSPNANPLQARRHPAREKLDVNVTYRWQKWCEVFFAIDNVTEEPAYHVIGPDGNNGYIGQVWDGQRRFNLGVSGKF